MSERLPLFPLNVVLFPTSRLPLHIFEERYKTLIGECVADGSEFGINLFESGKIFDVGCTAEVIEVVKRYDDGRMDIAVEGRRRYRLRRLVEARMPYHVGEVEYFDDTEDEVNEAIRMRAISLYNRLVEVVYRGTVPKIVEGNTKRLLSFLLVQKSGLSLTQRQDMLALRTENERLELLVRHLESSLPLLASQKKTEALIMNDGYLPPA